MRVADCPHCGTQIPARKVERRTDLTRVGQVIALMDPHEDNQGVVCSGNLEIKLSDIRFIPGAG